MGIHRPVLLDLDNTLFDWTRYYAQSFRAMVSTASRLLNISSDQLEAELKFVHQEYHSIEYPFSLQRTASCKGLDSDDVWEIVRLSRESFVSTRTALMQPYPGVRRSLQTLGREGHSLVVVTNAPFFQANHRLNLLGLSNYVEGIVAWEGWPEKDLTGHYDKAYVPLGDVPFCMKWKHLLPLDNLKPSPLPYMIASEHLGLEPSLTTVVGDSLRNDVAPGNALGANTVWARYGSQASRTDLADLLRITPWTDQQLGLLPPDGDADPKFTVERFADLLLVLGE